MNIDLHCHTTLSDGKLTPRQLITYALDRGVTTLSITDHDTVAAYEDLAASPLRIIPGVELSSQWRGTGIHVVGLNIDLHSTALRDAIAQQKLARRERARSIAEKLEKKGIRGALEGAARMAGNDNIGRPHFARYLVETGICKNISDAFSSYLGSGKSGNIDQFWPELPQVIDWICSANGIAVLAHPLTYKMTRTKLSVLLDEFISAGGRAMEVVSGQQLGQQTRDLAKICRQKNLLASCGSDFHQPDQSWAELGRFPAIPAECSPVWDYF